MCKKETSPCTTCKLKDCTTPIYDSQKNYKLADHSGCPYRIVSNIFGHIPGPNCPEKDETRKIKPFPTDEDGVVTKIDSSKVDLTPEDKMVCYGPGESISPHFTPLGLGNEDKVDLDRKATYKPGLSIKTLEEVYVTVPMELIKMIDLSLSDAIARLDNKGTSVLSHCLNEMNNLLLKEEKQNDDYQRS